MSDPSMFPRAIPPRAARGPLETPILLPRRAPAETAPAFSETDAEPILVRLRGAVAAGVSELGPILTAITETARLLTGAGGAAVALRCDGMVTCKARSGEPAPEVGVYLDEESGISGQCLRTGEIMRCDDTLTDFRVNPVVCRTLGLRSIAIVPIRNGKETFGILEAFSTRPHAFSESHIRFLSRLAELAGTAQEQERSRIELSKRVKMELGAKPAATLAEAEAAVEAEAKKVHESVLPSLAPAAVEKSAAHDAMVTRLREQLYEGRSLGNLYEPAKRRIPFIVAGAAVLALGLAWMVFGGSASEPAHHAAHRPADADIEPPAAQVDEAAVAEEASEDRPSPAHPMERAQRENRTREGRRTQHVERATTEDIVIPADSPSSQAATTHDKTVAAKVNPVAEVSGSTAVKQPKMETASAAPVRIEQTKLESARLEPAKPQPVEPETEKLETIRIEANAADGVALSSLLAAHAAEPRLGAPISGGVSAAVIEHQVQPIYPRFALERKLEGAVVLQATIADTGRVQSVRVISGQTILAQAAVDAVKQWRYRPTILDGKPVPNQAQITINFKAPR